MYMVQEHMDVQRKKAQKYSAQMAKKSENLHYDKRTCSIVFNFRYARLPKDVNNICYYSNFSKVTTIDTRIIVK